MGNRQRGYAMKDEGFEHLKVYQSAYQLALQIFKITKEFPKEEKYALIDQIRRSSRSVCANLAEAYRKRLYLKHYVSKMSDADGECSETMVWLSFSKDCGYLSEEASEQLRSECQEIGRMLGFMMAHPAEFGVKIE